MKPAHDNVALPDVIHQTVDIPAATRVIVVGDIHGCFDELQDLLAKVEFNATNDRLIFVGDLVNKGPKSCEVVRFAREHSVLCVRGNHDDAALAAYYAWKQQPDAQVPTKYEYVQRFSAEDVAFLASLPFTLTLPRHECIIVHAGLVPDLVLNQQEPINMYKMRWLARPRGRSDAEWTPSESHPTAGGDDAVEVRSWASQWPGPLHAIFGHDAVPGLQQEPFATGLDTGCCYGRQLTACILPGRTIVSVPARQAYAPMTAINTST